jgi:hypothetical protein
MKKILFITLLFLSIWLISNAQAQIPWEIDSSGNLKLGVSGKVAGVSTFDKPLFTGYTVATLPLTPSTGQIAVVTNGASSSDCTVGLGSSIVLCRYSGSAWASLGGGGGGGPATDLLLTGQAQGDITYFNGANWVVLHASTSGFLLETKGAGADPDFTGTVNITTLVVPSDVKFSANTTGAGTALLGTLNCPASTLSAPYTWLTVKSSDGSTVYIPVWK